MKIRKDFVTNSSSSSFIISRDQVTRGHLLDILLEMANEEGKQYNDDEDWSFDWNDVTGNGVGHFKIEEYDEAPYTLDDWFNNKEYRYHDVYVVSNDCCGGRYNWDVVESVLEKHGIEFTTGYCD